MFKMTYFQFIFFTCLVFHKELFYILDLAVYAYDYNVITADIVKHTVLLRIVRFSTPLMKKKKLYIYKIRLDHFLTKNVYIALYIAGFFLI